jgi:hypothetical protein
MQIDGAGLIVLDQLHVAVPFSTADLRHNLLHVVSGENAFHFTVGPLSLIIGAWALRTVEASAPTSVARTNR